MEMIDFIKITLHSFVGQLDDNTLLLSAGFTLLLIVTFCRPSGFVLLKNRKADDWLLDLSNLFVQGTFIPWLQVILIAVLLTELLPGWSGSLAWHPVFAFLFCFVVVDYGYYWNHRLLHSKRFWPIHMVHHTAKQMDVLPTSRNTLWTSFFILYLWVNGVMLYLLENPEVYLLTITLTALLDLWRHSRLQPKGLFGKLLGSVLVLPNDHAWHHSQDIYDINFGANLNLWDRLHGSWLRNNREPENLGVVSDMNMISKLWWPFR
ncbi:MAG: sterol desaturase [Moraxellaceae bacterium]|nr:MAG: sterol desaturase [Moraxellaceae bacterium]